MLRGGELGQKREKCIARWKSSTAVMEKQARDLLPEGHKLLQHGGFLPHVGSDYPRLCDSLKGLHRHEISDQMSI
jgi:hypothetical protein